MKIVKLKPNDKYTFIAKGGTETGNWVICTVIRDDTYGYLCDDVYILHNSNGPAFITSVQSDRKDFNPNIYALHGIIYDRNEWTRRLRKDKLKQILYEEEL